MKIFKMLVPRMHWCACENGGFFSIDLIFLVLWIYRSCKPQQGKVCCQAQLQKLRQKRSRYLIVYKSKREAEDIAQSIGCLPSTHKTPSSVHSSTQKCVVALNSNPSTQEGQAGGPEFQGHPGLHNKFEVYLSQKQAETATVKTNKQKPKYTNNLNGDTLFFPLILLVFQ